MSMLRECAAPGCRSRTLGEFCILHEAQPASSRTAQPVARPSNGSSRSSSLAPPQKSRFSTKTGDVDQAHGFFTSI
jgi:hypothetical protein